MHGHIRVTQLFKPDELEILHNDIIILNNIYTQFPLPITNIIIFSIHRVNPNYNEDSSFEECSDKDIRERLPSTSHYSTEKSGSSGYYSTNLYSVGSVDEHIYSEPVIQKKTNNVVNIDNSSSNSDNISDGGSCTNSNNDNNIQLDKLGEQKSNEMKCLESLQKSITELENSLSIHDTRQNQRQQNHIHPNQIPLLQQLQQQQQQHHQPKPLPTIMEGLDGQIPPRPIWPTDFDDSLMDINLDSFLMRNESPINNNGDNLSDRSQIDLIGLESPLPIILSNSTNPLMREHQKQQLQLQQQQLQMQMQKSQYEEFLNFHNTRNMLEVIRTKLENLLESTTPSTATSATGESSNHSPSSFQNNPFIINNHNASKLNQNNLRHSPPAPHRNATPTELEKNIINLKIDIDSYLKLMNQQNEAEIKQFCTGLSKNSKLLTLQNAVEQKNNSHSGSSCNSNQNKKINLHSTGTSNSNFYEIVNENTGEMEYYSMYSGRLEKMPTPSPPPPPPPLPGGNLRNYHHNTLTSNMSKYSDIEAMPSQFETVYVRDGFSLSYNQKINPFMDGTRPTSSPEPSDNFKRRSICFSSDHIYKYAEDLNTSSTPTTTMTNSSAENKPQNLPKNHSHQDMCQMKQNLALQNIMLMGGDKAYIGGDKDKMLLEWHRNKPSFWELYYGPNRESHKPHQTLINKMKMGRKTTTSMAYVSTI